MCLCHNPNGGLNVRDDPNHPNQCCWTVVVVVVVVVVVGEAKHSSADDASLQTRRVSARG